jgi:hypothetical protein
MLLFLFVSLLPFFFALVLLFHSSTHTTQNIHIKTKINKESKETTKTSNKDTK